MANQQGTQSRNETTYTAYGNWVVSLDPEVLNSLVQYAKRFCTEIFRSQGDLNGEWEPKFIRNGAWTAIPLANIDKKFVLTNPITGLQHELSPLATGLLGACAFWTRMATDSTLIENAKDIDFIEEANARLYDVIDSNPEGSKIWKLMEVL